MRALRRRLDQLAQHALALESGEPSSPMTADEIAAATATIARNRRLEPRDQLRALELYARLTGHLGNERRTIEQPTIPVDEALRRVNALLNSAKHRDGVNP